MAEEQKEYQVFTDDQYIPGRAVRIEHSVHLTEYDISDLLQKPVDEVRAMFQKSADNENVAHEIVQAALKQWEQQAAITQRLFRAMEYLDTPAAQHTGNQWTEDEKGRRVISNAVYKMTCELKENTRWDLWSNRSLNKRWHVEWAVHTNGPLLNYNRKVAGQERNFMDRTDAENYLNGRIRAFTHLFTELFPPVPEEYKSPFIVSEKLLPGYRLEGEEPKQEKPSVREQLKAPRAQKQEKPAARGSANKNEPEI